MFTTPRLLSQEANSRGGPDNGPYADSFLLRCRFHGGAMRQRILGSHTPPCHRRMVITTLFSVFLAALQRRPVLYHTKWLLTMLWHLALAFTAGGGGGGS